MARSTTHPARSDPLQRVKQFLDSSHPFLHQVSGPFRLLVDEA